MRCCHAIELSGEEPKEKVRAVLANTAFLIAKQHMLERRSNTHFLLGPTDKGWHTPWVSR